MVTLDHNGEGRCTCLGEPHCRYFLAVAFNTRQDVSECLRNCTLTDVGAVRGDDGETGHVMPQILRAVAS